MKTKLFFAAWVVILALSSGRAQGLPEDSVLRWADCVSIAAKNNPDLASAQKSVDASKASYSQSFNGILPGVTLSNSYSNSENATVTGGNSAGWQAGAQVSLDLFNMAQFASISISQAQFLGAQANLRQVSSNVRFNLSKAFYQLLNAQENMAVSKNIYNLREKAAQLVSLRYDSGTEYKGNKLRASAQLLQAQADVDQSVRDLRVSQRTLIQQLGLGEFTAIKATSTFDFAEPGELPQNEEDLISRRPDVLAQQATVKSSEASLRRARSPVWPSLTANYSYSGSGQDELPPLHSGWGIGLSYPLFGGGITDTYYAVAAAKSSLEKARLDLRSITEQAAVDIETSWSNLASAVDQVKVMDALLESARTRNGEADIRYDSGLMTYDNWEIIATDRITQEHQAIQAQLNALNAQAAWTRSLGKQLEE
jgi:outer membrane protein TolC